MKSADLQSHLIRAQIGARNIAEELQSAIALVTHDHSRAALFRVETAVKRFDDLVVTMNDLRRATLENPDRQQPTFEPALAEAP